MKDNSGSSIFSDEEEMLPSVSLSVIKDFLDEARVPALVSEEGLVPIHVLCSHIRENVCFNTLDLHKPAHGKPPVDRDSIKSLIIRKIFY